MIGGFLPIKKKTMTKISVCPPLYFLSEVRISMAGHPHSLRDKIYIIIHENVLRKVTTNKWVMILSFPPLSLCISAQILLFTLICIEILHP